MPARRAPPSDRYTTPFWNSLSTGEFQINRCNVCDTDYFPPAPICPHCGSTETEWISAEGVGSLYSFTRQHTTPPGFDAPLVLGLIRLVEGPRLLARIDAEFEALELNQKMELVPIDYEGGFDRDNLSKEPFFVARPQDSGQQNVD